LAQDGTVGDMDVDDEAPWTGSRRVPAWARPFRGARHVSERFAFAPRARTSRLPSLLRNDEADLAVADARVEGIAGRHVNDAADHAPVRMLQDRISARHGRQRTDRRQRP